jgi:hypothetical protein
MCATALKWSDSRRLAPFAFGLVAVLVWLWALRYAPQLFWYSAAIPWILCALTVGATEKLRRGFRDVAVGILPSSAPNPVDEAAPQMAEVAR